MKTKTVFIDRAVAKHAASCVWDLIQGAITLRKQVKDSDLIALNAHIAKLRATHKALKAASREGIEPRGTPI